MPSAQAKYLSFRDELDAQVFPCLGEFDGCRRLMAEIARKPGFLPEATWLAVHLPGGWRRPEYCGTVQGVRDRHGLGAIQNLGVVPEHRRGGLGTSLLLRALAGFRRRGRPPRVPGSDRPEQRWHPPLSASWIRHGQDGLQGRRGGMLSYS